MAIENAEESITATNRTASIRVVATIDGRPLRVEIDPREYGNGAETLAARVLEVCQLAGRQALAARRGELEVSGFDANMLARLGLPSTADLREQECAVDLVEDGEPQSWLAQV